MKSLFITSAATVASALVLFISITAFAQDNDKCIKNCDGKSDHKEYLEDNSYKYYKDLKCGDDTLNGRMNCKKDEEKKGDTTGNIKAEESNLKIIPAPKKYFMIPMLDSALVDTTVGC